MAEKEDPEATDASKANGSSAHTAKSKRIKELAIRFAKSRFFIPSIMMLVSLSLVAYAVTSVSVPNTVTIVSGANIQIIYQTIPFVGPDCPTTGYSANPSSVQLVIPAGGSTNAYLCVNNIGTGTDNPTISITSGDPGNCGVPSGPGPCFAITPTTLPPIPAHSFSTPTNLTISNNFANPQPTPFQLTVTVT